MIDVTDIFDSFHAVANLVWCGFEFDKHPGNVPVTLGPRFDEVIDDLEDTLFIGACRRRLSRVTGTEFDPQSVREMLRITDLSGAVLPHPACQFHSHGFDWQPANDQGVPNLIVGGNLHPRDRDEIRIFLLPGNGT
ncbi:MAG TPA: hypothetical protein VGB07_21700 [Blastocatellia bacterium]